MGEGRGFDYRTFWAVLAALVVFFLLVGLSVAYVQRQQVEQAQAAMDQFNDQLAVMTRDAAASAARDQEVMRQSALARKRRVAAERASDPDRYRLTGFQYCRNGSVYVRRGSLSTELLRDGRSVSCSGEYASDPLR
jgi:hypothetical protein